jgi:predicted XRE-type DNA-binding protein
MARNWREIRAEAVAAGRLDPKRADAARRDMHDAVQAHQLADIRRAQGHARQADVADLMGVSQARVSKLESGDLSRTELGTLQSYVAALGGRLRIIAEFHEADVELTDTPAADGRTSTRKR